MKHTVNRFMLLTALLAVFIIAGCDKEENPAGPSTQKPTSPKVAFSGPAPNSSNQYAAQANAYAMSFNGMTSLFSGLTDLPGGTQNGNVWTYSFTADGTTETVTVELLANGSYYWKISFSGTYEDGQGNPVTLTDWTAFEGTSSADNLSGSWKFYEEYTTTVEAELTWSTDAQGNETGILKSYEGGVLKNQMDLVNNSNGSGSVKLYSRKTGSTVLYLNVEILWNTTGAGTYILYNEDGTIANSVDFQP